MMEGAYRGLFWGSIVVMLLAIGACTHQAYHTYRCEKAGGTISLVSGTKKCVEIKYRSIDLK